MNVTGYAYPWDVLRDPAFPSRARDLGIGQIAVATAYHATRAGTPWLAGQSAMGAPAAALYRPVRSSVWRGTPLRPVPAGWLSEPDSAGDAIRLLRSAGLAAAPWIVLCHNSALGTVHPSVTMRNCFDETYPWALCPSAERVRDYAATLTAECVRDLDVDTVILESCGQMGVTHQGAHEKTDAIWSPAARRLLSVCCCPACAALWSRAGLDPASVRALLRDRVHDLIACGDESRTEDGLPAPVAAAVLACRHESAVLLRATVLAVLPPGTRVALHGSADPWATGALPGLPPTGLGGAATAPGTQVPAAPHGVADVASVVVPCWLPDEAVAEVRGARALLPPSIAIGAYVTVVSPAPPTAIDSYVQTLAEAGATDLHLYHLGLAGPARLPLLRAAATAATQIT